MSDFTLSDGRELTIDLYQVTIKEWRALLNPAQDDEEEYALLAKIVGWKTEDIANLSHPDFRLLGQKIAEKASNPVSDPNS